MDIDEEARRARRARTGLLVAVPAQVAGLALLRIQFGSAATSKHLDLPAQRCGGPRLPAVAGLELAGRLVLDLGRVVLGRAGVAEGVPGGVLELVRPTAGRLVVVARLQLADAGEGLLIGRRRGQARAAEVVGGAAVVLAPARGAAVVAGVVVTTAAAAVAWKRRAASASRRACSAATRAPSSPLTRISSARWAPMAFSRPARSATVASLRWAAALRACSSARRRTSMSSLATWRRPMAWRSSPATTRR